MTQVRPDPFADDPFGRRSRPRANPFALDPERAALFQQRDDLSPLERAFERDRAPDDDAADPFADDPFGRTAQRPLEEEDESPLEQRFRSLFERSDKATPEDDRDALEEERDRVRSEQEAQRAAQQPQVTRSPLEEQAEERRLEASRRARARQEAVRQAAYERYLDHLRRLQEEQEEEESQSPEDVRETRDDETYSPYDEEYVPEPQVPEDVRETRDDETYSPYDEEYVPELPDPVTEREEAAERERIRQERERQAALERERLASLERLQEAYDEAERLRQDRLRTEEQQELIRLAREEREQEEEDALTDQDDLFLEEYRAGKVAADDPEEDEESTVAGAEGLTPQIIEDIYYASIDQDPLSLSYLEYQITYGSLRPDFAGGPRVGGGPTGGPGGRFGQQPGDDEPEARVLDDAAEEPADEVEITALTNEYYYWDTNLGLVRITDGLFEGNVLPLEPVELPDDSTPFGRQARADLLNSLPEDVFYDPAIQQFVQIDDQGRRIIQADLSDSYQLPAEAWETLINQGRDAIDEADEPGPEEVLFYWDERLGLIELEPGTFDDGSFPLPPAELPDDSTPAGRRRRAELFLSLPENLYYNAEIRQWIEIDEEGRHIIQADLSGWAPGRVLLGYDAEGSPIYGTTTGPESIDDDRLETFISEIYFDETTGQWIGIDEHGRPVITDEEGYPIPLEQLDTFEPRGAGGPVDLSANAYTLRPGEFLPYIYDPLQDVWIAFRDFSPLLLAEAPPYTWDPLTGYFTLLNEQTGEFEIYNQEGVQIDQDGNPIVEEEIVEEEAFPPILLPTGEDHSRFDPTFDLPIVGSALVVAERVLSAMQSALEGDLLLTVGLQTYQESNRAGYIVGSTIAEAADDPDYADAVSLGFLAGQEAVAEVPLGDQLNIGLLQVPSAGGAFISAVEVWFTLVLDPEGEVLEAEEGRTPDETQLEEQIIATIGQAQEATADFVWRLLRERVPVRTGRLRDSIVIREVVPQGFLSERRLEIGATVFYAPFVAGYRETVGLAISQGQAYAEQFDVNIVVEATVIDIDQDPENQYGTLGPGVAVRLGARPDFVWGDDATWLGRQIAEWWEELWDDFSFNNEVDDPQRRPAGNRGD